MAHEVVFAPEALADLVSLYDHLAGAASPARALANVEQVQAYCLDFATFLEVHSPPRPTAQDGACRRLHNAQFTDLAVG